MKIDDVSLTIFTWDCIPATRYHLGALASSTSSLAGRPVPGAEACAMRSAARSRARRVACSMDRAAAPVTGATVPASAARSG